MKKIISVLTLASLALGIASADAKISLNYRTRMNAFSRVMTVGSSDQNAALKTAKYTSYMFNHTGYAGAADSIKFVVKNDFGGATIRYDPDAGKADPSALKELSGYVNIGSLTIGAGKIPDMYNGAYQLKGDASNIEAESFAAVKLGSLYSKAITKNIDDLVGFGDGSSSNVAGYATYKLDLDSVFLTASLAAVGLNGGNYNDTNDVYSGFAAKLDAKFTDWDVQFVFQQAKLSGANDDDSLRGIGLHVQPLSWGNLQATIGGALGFKGGELQEYNADLRFYYKSGALSVTLFNNLSAVTDSGRTRACADYAKHVGAYYCTTGSFTAVKNTVSQRSMWNMLGFRVKANDKLSLFLNMGDLVGFKANGKTFRDDYGMEAFIAPGLDIQVAKGAKITTFARFGFSNLFMNSDSVENGGYGSFGEVKGVMTVNVPVVIRITM